MKKICAAAALATLLAGAAPAIAETMDIGTIKCSELANMPDDEGASLFVWIAGYLSGLNGSTTMNDEDMTALGEKVGKYCSENPEVSILSAATSEE